MLGDNPEKSKNPLKKAMRRRNAKTVQFAAPTYVEASDYDYSSDEEHAMVESAYESNAAQAEEPDQGEQQAEPNDEAQANAGNSIVEQQAMIAAPTVESPLSSPKMLDKSGTCGIFRKCLLFGFGNVLCSA